jgi:alkanesulfonate monooxygenase
MSIGTLGNPSLLPGVGSSVISTARFHWFLPTGGDGRDLSSGVHGLGIGGGSGASAPRPASLAYLTQIARAADQLGYDAVLTPTGAHCADAWVVTSALIATTTRLKFMVAFRPGLVEPALAAHMAASFQELSGGRLLLNVVAGSSTAEQRAYGDLADHDTRYSRASEFLDIVRRLWTGAEFDHHGYFYELQGACLRRPPDPTPLIYFGGSSAPAFDVAAEHADVYLTWGEPPGAVAAKIAEARRQADRQQRTLRFGLRIHVVTRDREAQAWSDAERLIAGLSDADIAAGQRRLGALESVGQQRMNALHGGSRDALVVGPNLWAGVGLVRGGAGTALVGSHEQVAERISEYRAAGIDEFILSGYPHLEEAYAFAEGVRPLLG